MQADPHPLRSSGRVPSRRGFIVASIVAPAAVLAACGGDNDDTAGVIRLGSDELAPAVDDIQDNSAAGSDVDLEFTTFAGTSSNLASYAGRPLVINFFARTCPPCVAEMPEFEAVFQDFGGSVAFVGISVDARLEDAQGLVEQTGISYDLGWDPGGDLFSKFGGFAMPTTVFVTPEGSINKVWSGTLSAELLIEKVNELA